MDNNTAIVLVVSVLALVAVAFLLVFRSRGKARFKGPFGIQGTLDGGNEPSPRPPGITAAHLKAGGTLRAVNQAGGNLEVKHAEAKQDMTLGVTSPGETPAPKP